jgi:hypothetical protein
MIEFLIKRTDDRWFEIPASDFEEIVRPRSVPSRVLGDKEVYTLEMAGCEVSFSHEEPGLQVTFESGQISEEQAERLVSEIAASITAATGQKSAIIQISR